MTFLLDSREGSYKFASLEPVRSLLPLCWTCGGASNSSPECDCRGTGRKLSHIVTATSSHGPDALICGNGPAGSVLVAVEIKDINDLLQSAATGRLQAEGDGQLQIMLRTYDQSWLVWYGPVRHGDSGCLEEPGGRGNNGRTIWRPKTRNGRADGQPIKSEFFDAMLIAIESLGVQVHHEPNERGVARWLGALYRYWAKPYSEHTFTHTFSAAPRFPRAIPGVTDQQLKRARRVFDRYTGLGVERSLAAARHFDSVRAMSNATEKDWRQVPGIGKVLAAEIFREFNS